VEEILMSSQVPIELLSQSLKNRTHVDVSLYPEDARGEKTYKIIDHQIFQTLTGYLLILKVERNNETLTLSFPDIQSVELNNITSNFHEKYYLEILNRVVDREYQEILENRKIGLRLKEDDEKFNELEEKRTETLRIIVKTLK
jgi:hypothetical protein